MSNTIEIGTRVYVFDTEKQEPTLQEDMVCGSFINIESGDLYYYTTKYKQPHYAVATTLEEGEAKLKKFLEYRAFIKNAQAEVDEKRKELISGINFKDVVEEFYNSKSETQEPANE